jgi:hypothetical protein
MCGDLFIAYILGDAVKRGACAKLRACEHAVEVGHRHGLAF